MNLCQTLWESYDALKQAYSDAEGLLNEGKNHSNSDFQEAIDKLSIAKQSYYESLYTDLPDGQKIYTLDYLSLMRIANANNIEISTILRKQDGQFFLNSNKRISSLKLNDLGLTTLDVSDFSGLTELDCNSNNLNSLDVTKNTALIELYCYRNQLTLLDVSNNSNLTHLYCYKNLLSRLNLTNNQALSVLTCQKNQITSILNLKNLTNLKIVNVSDNPLDQESINLANSKGWDI